MYASIDIGTNSTLLLIGEPQADGSVRIVEDRATVTRLGAGLAKSCRLADDAAERTLAVLREYWALCTEHGVRAVAAVGTAALRTADNADDFLLVARREMPICIEVLSEAEEARLTFEASAHDFGEEILVLDIGGGSTEWIARGDDGMLSWRSLPIGCVNLTERFLKTDPVSDNETNQLRDSLRSMLRGHESRVTSHESRLVATAGTATTLMAIVLGLEPYDRNAVHGKTLARDALQAIAADLQGKTIAERQEIPGLDPKRAEVILAGAIVLDEAMATADADVATISDAGVKWGLFYERFCNR